MIWWCVCTLCTVHIDDHYSGTVKSGIKSR